MLAREGVVISLQEETAPLVYKPLWVIPDGA